VDEEQDEKDENISNEHDTLKEITIHPVPMIVIPITLPP
jgi:hypothetical protein